jgi:hypothetical protein
MGWLEVALVLCVLIGAAGGTALVVRSPSFWRGLAASVWSAAMPQVVKYAAKPMSPEDTRRFHDCVRRGGEWDHRTKRCK